MFRSCFPHAKIWRGKAHLENISTIDPRPCAMLRTYINSPHEHIPIFVVRLYSNPFTRTVRPTMSKRIPYLDKFSILPSTCVGDNKQGNVISLFEIPPLSKVENDGINISVVCTPHSTHMTALLLITAPQFLQNIVHSPFGPNFLTFIRSFKHEMTFSRPHRTNWNTARSAVTIRNALGRMKRLLNFSILTISL